MDSITAKCRTRSHVEKSEEVIFRRLGTKVELRKHPFPATDCPGSRMRSEWRIHQMGKSFGALLFTGTGGVFTEREEAHG